VTVTRFPIRFDRAFRVLSSLMLLKPSDSFVEIDGDEVRVRMAWGFRTRFRRSAVAAASEYRQRPLSRGVHGFAGKWLVNGAADGIVDVVLAPDQRAHVAGFPVRLRQLLVSVEDPAGLLAALRGWRPGPVDHGSSSRGTRTGDRCYSRQSPCPPPPATSSSPPA
jgi:hypothetical protein